MENFKIRPRLAEIPAEQRRVLLVGALSVLERTGVRVGHTEALELLTQAGSKVSADFTVRISPGQVEKAIQTAPKRVAIYNREGKAALELGGPSTGGLNTYYGTGSDLKNTYDLETGLLRATVGEDIARMARLVDALPNLDFLMSYGIPFDTPFDRLYRMEFFQMVSNSSKPIVFTSDHGEDSRRIIEMAAAVAGGLAQLRERPFVLNYSQPTSPLQHSEDALGKVLVCAELGIPVVYPPGMIPGATAPTTMAGAVTQSLAESLSALVIHQLKRPGAPIVLCGAHGWMDMSSAINVYAAPGRLLTQAVLAAIYQDFGLPTWGFGGCTDAQSFDQQAGAEFGMLNLWAALCGVNLAHDTGYLGSGLIGALGAVLFNDENVGFVRHLLSRGMDVNADTQALDVIDRVGPAGNYLDDDHTLRHFREELWRPTVSNRDRYEAWESKGGKELRRAADDEAMRILSRHAVPTLDQRVMGELKRILEL
ncbi:MAG: trimethylamine methyltransferase family protein [Acidobacteriota bacterium]